MALWTPFGPGGLSNIAARSAAAGGGPDTTTGLVSYWPFNDNSGLTVDDNQNVQDITITHGGSGAWGTGYYQFDGAGDYGLAADNAAYNFGTACTVFAWLKGPPQSNLCALSQFDFGNSQRSWFIGYSDSAVDEGRRMRVLTVDTNSQSTRKDYVSSLQIGTDAWVSAAFTWSSGTLELYVDGVKDTSVDTSAQNDSFTTLHNSTAAISFSGALNSGTIAIPAAVQMQRVRLYNVAKTAADIAAIHALGHA